MSISSEITRIANNVQNTIDIIEATGVTVPDGANSDNLPSLAAALANEKQDKLTGTQGQVVGFDEDGNAVPQAAPNAGVTSFNGRAGAVTPQTGDYTAEMVGALPIQTGTQGQVLGFTADNTVGAMDAPSGLPAGGTPGQMLYQGESGPEWGAPPESGMTQEDGDTRYLKLSGGTLTGDVYFAGDTDNSIGYQSKCIIYFEKPNSGSPFIKIQINNEDVATFYQNALDLGDITVRGVNEPSGKTDAVNKQYVDSYFVRTTRTINSKPLSSDVTLTAEDVGAGAPATSATITLTAAGWTGSAAPFSQQVSCSIVAADTAVVAVDVDTPGTDADADAEAINAWALCTQQNPTQGAGTLTFYCREKPTINIPVKVGVA